MTTVHTRQLQQYTQNNYNTHKTTTTIHTAKPITITHKTYTTIPQDSYNNTNKTTAIHTRQLKSSDNTCETKQNRTCTKGQHLQNTYKN